MENNNTEEKEKKTGILYMTGNDNMFIGEQNMSPADYTRFSLETDINAFKEKIAKLEAELAALGKGEQPGKNRKPEASGYGKIVNGREKAKEEPAVLEEKTEIPEFALLTPKGIRSFRNMTVRNFNEVENTYTLENEDTVLTVTKDTYMEITGSERFERHYDEKTPEYEKLIQSQYENYFQQRKNTAENFRHNLEVYCRKEANTPLDALMIAKEIVTRMDSNEKEKTRKLLTEITGKDESINQLIVRTYFGAVRDVPLNKETVIQKRNEKLVTTPFYDTISDPGQKIDRNSALKIGDTIKGLAFNTGKIFGHGKENIYEDLTVISASREGNNVILMDKNRSYYEVPRDTLLKGYNRQQEKLQKAEMKRQKENRIAISWER